MCWSFSRANDLCAFFFFFFSSRRRHTRFDCDWSSDVCSSDLSDLLAADPANDDARFDYVRLLIATGGYEEAGALLAEPLKRIPQATRFEALNQWLQCMLFVHNDERGNWEFAQFDAVIAQNKRDFDTRSEERRVGKECR